MLLYTRRQRLAVGAPQMHVMADQSISWDQPMSGADGWEGYCGQVAVANLLTTYFPGHPVSPIDVARVTVDAGPGTMPETLLAGVQTLVPNSAAAFRVFDTRSSIGRATPQTPVVCLLSWDDVQLHYVTVVHASSTDVIFNHWGIQATLPLDEFYDRWDLTLIFRLFVADAYMSIRHV